MGKSMFLTFHSERKRMALRLRAIKPMNRLRFATGVALIAACAWGTSARATAVETSQGYLTGYFTGWNIPMVRVSTDFTFTNPDGCTNTNGYVTDPANGGTELFNATLLTAFTAHKKISLVIDGCYLSWPKIIGVYVWP
jgi:hypothetical protein